MRQQRNYRLIVIIAFLQGLVFYAPVATAYRLRYGITVSELFLIESLSWILMIVLEVPFGVLADRFGQRRALIAGNLLFALSKLVFVAASGFALFLAERVLLALALAALSGAAEAFLSASIAPEDQERRFGHWNAAGTAGLLAAALVSPLLYGRSFRLAAAATVPPYLAAVALSLFLIEPGGTGRTEAARTAVAPALRAALRDRGMLGLLLVGALMGEFAQAATVFLSQLQYARSGIAQAWYGVLFAAIQAASLASAAAGGLAKAAGRRNVLLAAVGLSFLCALALTLSTNAFVSIAALLATAASVAIFRPLFTVVQVERLSRAGRATALSLNAMIVEGASAAVNLGEGPAAQVSLALGFGVFAAGLGLVFALSPFIFRAAGPEGGF